MVLPRRRGSIVYMGKSGTGNSRWHMSNIIFTFFPQEWKGGQVHSYSTMVGGFEFSRPTKLEAIKEALFLLEEELKNLKRELEIEENKQSQSLSIGVRAG